MLGHRRDLVVSMFTKMIPLGTFGRERQVLPEESGHETMYRPTIESDFSVPVVFHPEGRVETFKYLGSELICEASGPDFQTAMIHTTSGGIATDEPWTANLEVPDPRIEHGDAVSEG